MQDKRKAKGEGELTVEEFCDGWALWQEHRPQTAEDWVAVAERFIADGGDVSKSSVPFAGLVLAVEREHPALVAKFSEELAADD